MQLSLLHLIKQKINRKGTTVLKTAGGHLMPPQQQHLSDIRCTNQRFHVGHW